MQLTEAARQAGAWRWSELAVWELLGRWVPSEPEASVKLLFDRHGQHAAWRAAQWWDRLPVLAGMDRDGFVRPPEGSLADLFAALGPVEGTAGRLAALHHLALPRLADGYRTGRGRAGPVSDGPLLRTLDRVEPDLAADAGEVSQALDAALVATAARAQAQAVVDRLRPAFS